MYALVVILVLLLLAWLALTEFSYFGSRATWRIYDWTANRYDRKHLRSQYSTFSRQEVLFLSPIRRLVENRRDANVIDLACGTGRLSTLLLKQPWFLARIEAYDYSPVMLNCFRKKLGELPCSVAERILLQELDISDWSGSGTQRVDVVMLLEAGEFLSEFEMVVAGSARSLKPGGLFLLTKPPDWLAWLFFGRGQSRSCLRRLLHHYGFEDVVFKRWHWRYSVVYARKSDRGGSLSSLAQ